jgi:N-formylglutamate amidohydrolase
MFLVTLPHSGERIPELCTWLKQLPEQVLLRDVDRFVDKLYEPVIQKLNLLNVKTEWHRYAADLNREPSDVDQDSVEGASLPAGKMPRGFHWVITTYGEKLMPKPISQEDHKKLVNLIYTPFHQEIFSILERNRKGKAPVWHLDLHSMPSRGTAEHRDPGDLRADIVISDFHGRSADKKFVDLVITSYVRAGFKVGYNWPYYGGKITEIYGRPDRGHHTVQVELNRGLYMDEHSKEKNENFPKVQMKLEEAINQIYKEVVTW